MGLLPFPYWVYELDEAGLTVGTGQFQDGYRVESISFQERGITMPSEDEAQAADLSSQVS